MHHGYQHAGPPLHTSYVNESSHLFPTWHIETSSASYVRVGHVKVELSGVREDPDVICRAQGEQGSAG